MLVEIIAGALLAAGAAATLVAAARSRELRASRAVLALALATAAAGYLAEQPEAAAIAGCALAIVAVVLHVLARAGSIDRLSWLDAVMGATALAGLAVEAGAAPAAALGAGGVAAGLALCRWRPGWALVLALAGVAALGAGVVLAPVAALAVAAAAWVREPPATPGPEFSPVVLTAILGFATIALGLLAAGQLTAIDDVAIALASLTWVAGMARAGITVVERLRESRTQALTDDLTGLGNRRHLVDTLHAAIASPAERARAAA